jgi:hypothetical protein
MAMAAWIVKQLAGDLICSSGKVSDGADVEL